MKHQARVAIIQKILNEHFPDPAIPLTHHSSYTLLIAVVLSARSTDVRVNIVTPQLFAAASTPQDMVKLPVSAIQAIIRPCGLSPQKAQRIHDLSQILLDRYEGQVPSSLEKLEQLPGVGHKTASVVMAQAFHIPAFPVDTHIYRSARRWGLSQARSIVVVEEDLKKCFRKEDWIRVHLQIIYYCRAFCPARGHQLNQCPICKALGDL
ncbi:MAG: endonuclease III [Verrucomicrobia bacterium]|nr:endonuclease III [Verrucomicrobiota bacterium]MBS0646307.1 endonuclease III [Verrucomicrobiota bacterium]